MHQAGRMIDQLRNYVSIDDRTNDLIQLGGLYHDIGHFSFSHLFDSFLELNQHLDNLDPIFKLPNHEDRSVYFLRKVNLRLKLLTQKEEQFVTNVIMGIVPEGEPPYLYSIIHNKFNGLDVDKQDYIKRDSVSVGLPGFQSDYILLNCLVDDEQHLAFRQKTYNDIKDLFDTRHRMFEKVYLHHTARKIDKIYYCMMKRLGSELFKYGENTDDYNIETLFRNHESTRELVIDIDRRRINHNCENCKEYSTDATVKKSGGIEDVRFVP
jgi:HD superfamily phosphohydrolase